MQSPSAVNVGDRIRLRDRPWRVRSRSLITDSISVLELQALDLEEPRSISVATPPDEFTILPNESLGFDLKSMDAFHPWVTAHHLIGTALTQETGLLTGSRFGRVALEAYQLAPTYRLLSMPRARLLIADDVGLGKTIEAGLLLLELAARRRAGRVLVVVPPGLLLQWQEELEEKFGMRFVIIDNAAGLASVQTDLPAGVNPWDALPRVLTSVDFLKKDTIRNRALRKRWDLIIVDEAHSLAEAGTPANPYRTQRSRLGTDLRDNSRGLILLTATPHNGYAHSFQSLLDLVSPASAVLSGTPQALRRRVQTSMIRRMKSQIRRRLADGTEEEVFPRRVVQGIPVPLRPKEKELLHKVAAYCSKTARSAEGTDEADLVTFAMQIVKKRALSSRKALEETLGNRLAALRNKEQEETAPSKAEIRELQADLPLDEKTADRTATRIIRSAVPKEERRRKAEISALNGIRRVLKSLETGDPKIEALLAEMRSAFSRNTNDKVIVFTEYLDTLYSIQNALDNAKDLSGRAVVLKGGLSSRQRVKVQDKFESADVRILLATDAGSEGLNLQRCCHRVIHMELPWNPNRLEQRNGRVDRYGQTLPPQVRYLYYPDSPEDDVLHRLVMKIEQMQGDRVSTPDILGIVQGLQDMGDGLVRIDPENDDIERAKNSLVRLFEDRTEDFIRNVQPLVSAGPSDTGDNERILELLNTAHGLLPDDERLEGLVLDALGSSACKPAGIECVFRIEVPRRYCGPGVQPTYPMATFRRSVAVKYKASDVAFITPLHPLVQALASEARNRLLHVYPDERGLPARRLAARMVSGEEPASAVFTFVGDIVGGAGLLEQNLIAVRVTPSLDVVDNSVKALSLMESCVNPGNVDPATIARLFKDSFQEMAEKARESASLRLSERAQGLRLRRREQGQILKTDLEIDLADKICQIKEDERRHVGEIDAKTGQLKLFTDEQHRTTSFDARRAVARQQAESRRKEIEEFEQVEDPQAPRPLGALFLVPQGTS